MGQDISHEELPAAPPGSVEDLFKPVRLTPLAIDMASKVVPEQYWKPYGLYSWLERKADAAFKQLPSDKYKIKMGKLNYIFEYADDGPILKKVHL